MFKVAVLVGSTRPNSTNLQFARALEKLALGRLQFDYVDVAGLPFYDETLWDNPPEPVLKLKQQIVAADAVLFVTPEYNRSIPGILKNAIDWPSRPYGQSVWENKPGAIVGATSSPVGTAAAQAHLRSIAVVLGIALMGRPEVYQTLKPGMIDENFLITDERTRLFLAKWVDAYVAWIGRFAVAPQLRSPPNKVPVRARAPGKRPDPTSGRPLLRARTSNLAPEPQRLESASPVVRGIR